MDRRDFLRLASTAAVGLGIPARAGGWAMGMSAPREQPWQPGAVKIADRTLLFHGVPFPVRGVVYQPTPVGQDPSLNDGSYTAYSDPRIGHRDFPLLRKLGANTIRIYRPRDIRPEFFQEALAAGLYVILGFEVDTRYDFTAGWARNQIVEEFRRFVHTWRGQPSILMWAIGNGVNAELRRTGREAEIKSWHSLADAMARAAHEEERTRGRPVLLVSSESADIGTAALGSDDVSMPNLDLWGVNAFRGPSFGSLFDDLKSTKPVLITEYGLDVHRHGSIPELDPLPRAHAIVNLTNEIGSRPDKVIGGCLFEFSDEWWRVQPGRPDWHEWGSLRNDSAPDGMTNLEWFGLYGTSPSSGGLDLLQERRVVHYLINAWAPRVASGQPAVWFDVPLARDVVEARPRVSGHYSGLKPGWEIFVTVTPVGSSALFVQPESCVLRAPSGSWVAAAYLGPDQPPPNLELELSTLVAKTPEAAAALRECARTGSPLPPADIIGRLASVRIRRR
jgi:hypothetical protein